MNIYLNRYNVFEAGKPMGDSVYLLELKISGMKNLEKEVGLSFYSSSNLKKIDIRKHPVTGIYGPNGSGKTAILLGVRFALGVISDPYCLSKRAAYLDKLMNRMTGRFSFSASYAIFDRKTGKTKSIHRYSLLIEREQASYAISHEKLESVPLYSLSADGSVVYETDHGQLRFGGPMDEASREMASKSRNLLSERSFSSVANSIFAKDESLKAEAMEANPKRWGAIESLKLLWESTDVHFQTDDRPTSWPILMGERFDGIGVNSEFVTLVKSADYDDYLKRTERLARFIKVFKPSLERIDVTKKERGDGTLACANTLVYRDCMVDEEFESAGVRQLISIFDSLDACSAGAIVFIDEMDIALSGSYLYDLVDYFASYGNGQLIFTAHNTDPMKALCSYSKAIYFLGEGNTMASWIRNGHYKPYKLYSEGFIDGAPFNQGPIDFLPVFYRDDAPTIGRAA